MWLPAKLKVTLAEKSINGHEAMLMSAVLRLLQTYTASTFLLMIPMTSST